MNQPITFKTKLHFQRTSRGQKRLKTGTTAEAQGAQCGRVPRISRLMALAIRFDELLRDGTVADQAELARLGHVTRARVTQIMNLLCLAPNLQEQLLHLPMTVQGRDNITEKELRPIAANPSWNEQRLMWKRHDQRPQP